MKSSSFNNNEDDTHVHRESQIREMKHSVTMYKAFIETHEKRTQRLVDERLDYLHEKWELSYTFRSVIGWKKKVAFEEWLKKQNILEVWPDGTNLEETRPTKVFGLVVESLTYVVNDEYIVKLKPNNRGWLDVKSIELKG